jgi:subtilisin family serine protease
MALTGVVVTGLAGCSAPGPPPVPGRPAATPAATPGPASSGSRHPLDYLVFYAPGRKAEAVRAVEAAGAVVSRDEPKLGYLVVRAAAATFPARAATTSAIAGIAPNRRMGATDALRDAAAVPGDVPRYAPIAASPRPSGPAAATAGTRRDPAGERSPGAAAGGRSGRVPKAEPLADRQWNMRMIGATPTGSYGTAPGTHQVLVGVIDTGVDGKHPDIAPNFNRELSRNFVQDIPEDASGKKIDGPCEHKGCVDPPDVDDDGHGTHVASIIGSPINGLGVAGVAPGVSLVNLRAGQDSGYFFLKPVLDALTYAGDTGIDVVNMSFYVDPWLYNCADNPADSPAQRLEQAGVRVGVQRALDYARARGVTLITAMGNEGADLGKVRGDDTSPDYPKSAAHDRTLAGSCVTVPTESRGVIGVAALGPSGRKAFYSDYGVERTDVAAPGGDVGDDGTGLRGDAREILAAAPEHVLRAEHRIRRDGTPADPGVVRDCAHGTCAYYQYLEGTSMASPHATGVAAVLIARNGEPGKGGLRMDPAAVERLLYSTATRLPCPAPRAYHYPDGDQVCEDGKAGNGFFGRGMVSAEAAAATGR